MNIEISILWKFTWCG